MYSARTLQTHVIMQSEALGARWGHVHVCMHRIPDIQKASQSRWTMCHHADARAVRVAQLQFKRRTLARPTVVAAPPLAVATQKKPSCTRPSRQP